MTQPKPAIKSMDLADIDAALSAVSEITKQQNIPAIVHPQAQTAEVKPIPVKKKGPQPAPTHRTSIDMPDYLRKEIGRKYIDSKQSLRFQILNALKASGYTVHDIDLDEDRRRA